VCYNKVYEFEAGQWLPPRFDKFTSLFV